MQFPSVLLALCKEQLIKTFWFISNLKLHDPASFSHLSVFQRSLFNIYLREGYFVCITATSIKQLHLARKLGALPQRTDSKDLQFVVNCEFLSFFPLHFRHFKTFFRRTLAQIFPSNTKMYRSNLCNCRTAHGNVITKASCSYKKLPQLLTSIGMAEWCCLATRDLQQLLRRVVFTT